MGVLRRLVGLIFLIVYGAIFVSFLYPIFNPDLFWHLAAARAAEAQGRLFLSEEIFSFTRAGQPWINFEWLFDWLVYQLYKLGGFRLLVFFRALLLCLIILAADFYVSRMLARSFESWKFLMLRLASIIFTFLFVSVRGSLQPELFSLLFLLLFFHLRDQILAGGKARALLLVYSLLFALWPNLHGGFVLAIGILGLQVIARILEQANAVYRRRLYSVAADPGQAARLSREALMLSGLAGFAFFSSWFNPYGWRVYEVIFLHLRDAAHIAHMIDEWQPSQFYSRESWPYFILLVPLLINLAAWTKRHGRLPMESVLISIVFAWFASRHVRHVAVFGLVCLPVFWSCVKLADAKRSWLARLNWALVSAGLVFGVYFLASVSWAQAQKIRSFGGIPRTHVRRDSYPHLAVSFIEANKPLWHLPALVEWGWAGYTIWRLHEKGWRTFFDGRYLFHEDLHESMQKAEDPEQWSQYVRLKGVDLLLLKYPKDPDSYRLFNYPDSKGVQEPVLRSWHSQAIDRAQWALVWWDHVALVFVRRDKVPQAWLKEREYKSRFPIDPYWVERQVRLGEVKIQDLVEEIRRNISETGSNRRNTGLAVVLEKWQVQYRKK